MTRQVSFYLDRARAAARATSASATTELKPVVEALARTFDKVYAERGLEFAIGDLDSLRFRGEVAGPHRPHRQSARQCRQMGARESPGLGRARHRPRRRGRPFFFVRIDDDGPGLDPDARAAAVQRGLRLDESRPGSGLGLSIVVDLAAVYGGSLSLEDSPLGGLRATLRLPCLWDFSRGADTAAQVLERTRLRAIRPSGTAPGAVCRRAAPRLGSAPPAARRRFRWQGPAPCRSATRAPRSSPRPGHGLHDSRCAHAQLSLQPHRRKRLDI